MTLDPAACGVFLFMDLKKAKKQYDSQKRGAADRGIDWDLTFKQWADVWLESGCYHLRGRQCGQYVMCRHGDKGPYALWNVAIRTTDSNAQERIGLQHSQMRRGQIPEGNSWLKSLSHLRIDEIDRERQQDRDNAGK